MEIRNTGTVYSLTCPNCGRIVKSLPEPQGFNGEGSNDELSLIEEAQENWERAWEEIVQFHLNGECIDNK